MRVDETPSDLQLLERFGSGRQPEAFGELVRRHGPLVLGVCRRVLGHDHDADDAFQATFVVLARKARAVDASRPLAQWLYGVALRIALDLRASSRAREARERTAAGMRREAPSAAARWDEVRRVLDEEVERLPDRYRSPFILCYLEGKSNDDAARSLGCPRGTVSTRLGRAREILRRRLEGRGVVVTGTVLASFLVGSVSAATVPPALAAAAAHAAAGTVSPQVAVLVSGGIKAMTAAKVKAAVWVAVVLTGSSLSAVAYRGLAEPQTRPAGQAAVPDELKRNFDKLCGLLRPLPGEYDWREAVPWHTRIQPARRQAAKENKPLLIFSCANAFVLGRT